MHQDMHIIFKMSSIFDAFGCNIWCIFVAVLCNILCIFYAILCINAYIMHDICGILRGNFDVVVILYIECIYLYRIQGIYSFAPAYLKVKIWSIVILFMHICICNYINRNALHIEGHFLCDRNVYLINFIYGICPTFRAIFNSFVITIDK